MPPRFIGGIGPTFNNDIQEFLLDSGNTEWGVDIVAATADAALTPDGPYWLKVQRHASAPGSGHRLHPEEGITDLDFQWAVFRNVVAEGSLTTGHTVPLVVFLSDNFGIFARATGASTWCVYISGGGDILSSDLDIETKYSIRVQMDGTTIKIWANGVLIGSGSNASKIDNRGLLLQNLGTSSITAYYEQLIILDSDDESDRPGFDVETSRLNPNADWATENTYGDQAGCVGTAGTYTDLILDGSDFIQTGVFICGNAAEADAQMSEVDDVSLTNPILGIVVRTSSKNSGGSPKTVNFSHRISDGTTAIDKGAMNLTNTAFQGRIKAFSDPPSSTWEALLEGTSSLKMGVLSSSGNNADDHHCAMIAEVFAVDNDPPSTSTPAALSETADFEEDLVVALHLRRSFVETISLAEALSKRMFAEFDESLDHVETLNRRAIFYRAISESMDMSEALAKKVAKVLSETIGSLSESLSLVVGKLFTDSVSLSETLLKLVMLDVDEEADVEEDHDTTLIVTQEMDEEVDMGEDHTGAAMFFSAMSEAVEFAEMLSGSVDTGFGNALGLTEQLIVRAIHRVAFFETVDMTETLATAEGQPPVVPVFGAFYKAARRARHFWRRQAPPD